MADAINGLRRVRVARSADISRKGLDRLPADVPDLGERRDVIGASRVMAGHPAGDSISCGTPIFGGQLTSNPDHGTRCGIRCGIHVTVQPVAAISTSLMSSSVGIPSFSLAAKASDP